MPTIKEKEESFWKRKYDAAGQEASPIDLLLLGSLRILTRNVTLDDMYEQTYTISEVHRLYFSKFMHLYNSRVFPEVVKMPSLEELSLKTSIAELVLLVAYVPLTVSMSEYRACQRT